MKKRIIALIACVLVSGTAGAFAKSVNTNAVPAGADTVTSTAEALANNPVSANPLVAAVQKTAGTTSTCSNGVQAALKSVASKTTSNPASSCPKNSAAQQAVKAAVNSSNKNSNCSNSSNSANTVNSVNDIGQYLKSLNCNKNGNYVNGVACLSGSNCKTGNCVSLINCLYGVNCKTGNCSTSNCKNSSNANTNSSNGSTSSSNSTTSSNTSSAPVSSAPQGNTSSTPSSTSGSYSSFQNQVVQLVNKERAANGLKALTVNAQLTKTATLKSEDMILRTGAC